MSLVLAIGTSASSFLSASLGLSVYGMHPSASLSLQGHGPAYDGGMWSKVLEHRGFLG